MKILQLDLMPFGPFADLSLDFRQGRSGLHIVFGPNEAGKSSTLRALTQVLFGIEPRTPDNFRFPYSSLKLGATLADKDGKPFPFIRLKRNKDPLRTADNQPLSENCLGPFLGHVSKDVFVRQFGLNWQTLQEGGEEMVRSDGELSQILFAAGSGLTVLTQVRKAIDDEMRKLFLPSGSVPEINKLLKRLKEVDDQLRQVRLSSQEWQRHAEAVAETQRVKKELADKKKNLERSRKRLQRIHSAKVSIQKFRDCQRELEDLKHAVLLPEDFPQRRLKARDQLRAAQQAKTTLQADIARIAEQIGKIAVNQAVLDHAAEIESLYKQIDHYLESVKDCPIVNSKREAAEKEARHLLQGMRPGFPFEQVDDLRIAEEVRTRIGELGPDFRAISERVESARNNVADAQQQLKVLLDRRQTHAEVPDPSALKSALKHAAERGPLEEMRDEKQRAIAAAEVAAANACACLPFWSGGLAELNELKVPFRETLNQFQSRFDEVENQRRAIEKDRAREQGLLQENIQEFHRLELDGKVSTEEDLIQARDLRERGWRMILACWRDGEEPTSELQQFLDQVDASDLAAGFQKAVAQADAISDHLRREANRVTEKKRLMTERAKLEALLPELESRIAEQQQTRDALEQQWRELWSPLGEKPGTPGEMLAWREDYKEIEGQLKELRANEDPCRRLSGEIEEHRRQLTACLTAARPALSNLAEKSLRELIEQSQTVLEEISEEENQRVRLEEEIQKIEQSLPKLEQAVQSAEAKLSTWQKRWGKLMEQLGLPPDASPGQANTILATLEKLFKRLEYESLEAIRVQSMQNVNQHYEERVGCLVRELQWDARDSLPAQVVSQLHGELTRAREAANKLGDLHAEQERQRNDIKRCELQIQQAEADLRELCRQADCENPDDLSRAEEESAQRRQFEAREREAREQILQFVGDATFEEFLHEADAEDADALSSQLSDMDGEIEELDAALARQIEIVANEKNLLDAKSGGSQAALAAQDKQAILAEMGGHLERYVQLRLALEALREGAERYRKKNQGPVLGRASELFRLLTGGSFLGLRNDGDDEGNPRLAGVRLHNGAEELVEVKGMSDGTADQLYLALRVASLENWLDHHPRVPFIVDDILINFDDQRAIAALKVLAELSQRTQVIFFTHHRHLVELALENLPKEVCFHHKLGEALPNKKQKSRHTEDTAAAKLF